MERLSLNSILDILIKKFSYADFKIEKEKHMFSFLDKDNPYEISSLHWDEYGNPYIYIGDSQQKK